MAAEFDRLPSKIKQLVEDLLFDESVRFCAIGGLFQPDFIILTTQRLLVLTEQIIGNLMYTTNRCNLEFEQIIQIDIDRTLWQKFTNQACLKIETGGVVYFVKGLSLGDAKQIITLVLASRP